MTKEKSYKQLKEELDEILRRLDSEMDDLDRAIKLHGEGQKVIKEIEKYLDKTKAKIEIVNKNQK